MQEAQNLRLTNTRRFAVEDVRRIPVTIDPVAQGLIARSSMEGRRFPLALSEHFGRHAGITSVEVEAVPKSVHFPLSEGEDANTYLLHITIRHTDPAVEAGEKWINAADLNEIHPSGLWGFQSASAAAELFRLHCWERGL